MPRFAANLSMLYTDLPFLDRFEAAARDGFEGVEYLFPYAFSASEIAARLQAHGLQQVLFNTPPGGTDAAAIDAAWAAGDRGTACVPGREAEFREGVRLALDYAQALGCPRIHLMAGLLPVGVAREAARATYGIAAGDTMLQFASLSFDASAGDLPVEGAPTAASQSRNGSHQSQPRSFAS